MRHCIDCTVELGDANWSPSCQKRSEYRCRPCRAANDAAYHATPKGRFRSVRESAIARRIDFSLAFDEFLLFWQKPCTYCGSPITTVGIDRIDSGLGYVAGNMCSCCATCNYMKERMGVQEFVSHCLRVADHAARNSLPGAILCPG